MDLSPVSKLVISALWYLLPLAVMVSLIKNVTLPTEDGTTQIDHVLVSEFGIFVVETKNMEGWIFGGAQRRSWSQKIYRSKGEVD